jgi:hypothetical protein
MAAINLCDLYRQLGRDNDGESRRENSMPAPLERSRSGNGGLRLDLLLRAGACLRPASSVRVRIWQSLIASPRWRLPMGLLPARASAPIWSWRG